MVDATLQLPWRLSSARLARAVVRKELIEQQCNAAFIDDATILTSELVANALLHARPVADDHIHLRLRSTPTGVRVQIADGSPTPPITRPMGDGGRGLHIVEAIATRWGTLPTSTGKTVWFELEHP